MEAVDWYEGRRETTKSVVQQRLNSRRHGIMGIAEVVEPCAARPGRGRGCRERERDSE